jgi:histidine triad (HIT) family protein
MPDDCLFCRMSSGAMEVPKIFEDDLVFAIRDINPRAPVHLLLIPHEHISTAMDVGAAHGQILARMYTTAAELARNEGFDLNGYRLAVNCGDDAGQTVYHLHMHVLAGKKLGPEG